MKIYRKQCGRGLVPANDKFLQCRAKKPAREHSLISKLNELQIACKYSRLVKRQFPIVPTPAPEAMRGGCMYAQPKLQKP